MAKRRYTTKREDAEFLARVYDQVHKQRKVGDEVLIYQGGGKTCKIAKIEGVTVTLENGDTMHIGNCRDPGYSPFRK